MNAIRPAAVAGMFYPADRATLQHDVTTMLAQSAAADSPTLPKALIVPHAGYIYSGPVAASAYARIAPWRERIRRVVTFGPVHRVAVQGIALPEAEAFATPLGTVPIDRAAAQVALGLPQVGLSVRCHEPEHSLEVQLPFLIRVLGEFSLLPFAVGYATPREVAEVIELLWGGDEPLIVISSDLSHYHSDRGVQYCAGDYRNELKRRGIAVSMSRRANCYDNAPMESTNGTLKVERVHDRHYATRREAIDDLTAYIGYYNTERRHSALDYVSPAEFERRWKQRNDAPAPSAASYPPARASRAYEAPHARARG